MSSRLLSKSRLLNQVSTRQAIRSYASESKQAAQTFPEESKLDSYLFIQCYLQLFWMIAFGGNAWRNGAIAIVAGLVWYRVDQHITQSGDVRFMKIVGNMPPCSDILCL